MNIKGFTLVELLAVVIILALLALITSTSVTKIVKDSKNEISDTQMKLIELAAKTWGADNLNILPPVGECSYLTLGDLKEYGLIDSKVIDSNTNKELSDNLKIKITTTDSSITNYEVNPSNVSTCLYVYAPKSFGEDNWETIALNIKRGNINKYKVGDTKEIKLKGFANGEKNSNGLYTIRIANISTPEECSKEEFSQTACGFVIEFVDIITNHNMNSTDTNKGGWKDSEMRTYVNDTIYNSLPDKLKNNIIDTYVVSGHGASDTKNFTTTDKIYLLSTKEVYGQVNEYYDAAQLETRQLDYYENIGSTSDNTSLSIKYYNNSATYWWLRTAINMSTSNGSFKVSHPFTIAAHFDSTSSYGVSPAFRIG